MLKFDNISKTYGHVVALQNASLEVGKGEIRGILGGNGSGKSTLVKIAAGTVMPDAGTIFINNNKISISSPRNSRVNGIAATSQELSIVPNLTVWENMLLCNIPVHGAIFANKKKAKEQCLSILNEFGMEERLDCMTSSLPKNEQYMVEFGKALIQNSDILLLDEITSALYGENVDIVRKKLHEYKKTGKTVLFISHRMEELYSICDSVTIMRNGEVIGTYKITEKNSKELLILMVGKEFSEIEKIETKYGRTVQPFISAKKIPVPHYNKIISLEIGKGEIIGISGLQGHGQSDIVRTLHGLNGHVEVNIEGKTRIIRNPRQAVKNRFAFISGDREVENVFCEHSIIANMSIVSELVKKTRLKDVDGLISKINVKCVNIHQNITSLSGGNQQKIIVGRWTGSNPALILADDPTKGIDVQARSELHALFAVLAKQGTSLIMVSSDDNELVSLCTHYDNSRVIVLYEGEIVKTLRGEEITSENIIASAIPRKKVNV